MNLFSQVIRECLNSSSNHADVIFSHDDLYDSGIEAVVDKAWSWRRPRGNENNVRYYVIQKIDKIDIATNSSFDSTHRKTRFAVIENQSLKNYLLWNLKAVICKYHKKSFIAQTWITLLWCLEKISYFLYLITVQLFDVLFSPF